MHPVAVIIARVTVLLALGEDLGEREGALSVPVFLGNAMQWDVREDEGDLVVHVPPDEIGPPGTSMLRFPLEVCAEGPMLEAILGEMHRASDAGEKAARFAPRLARLGVPEAAREELAKTYGIFHKLRLAGRDHVWGYVARNLSRPIALSAAPMDVILGNPPWLSYRFMSRELKARFRDGSKALRVWVAEDRGHLVTQTDLSGYFFARSAQLYLRRGGRIAMVLPLAAMTRGQFAAFRTGRWTQTRVRFTNAWVLDNEDIEPLFHVPTCVLFAERIGAAEEASGLPATVTAFLGRPPRKDASLDEVRGCVREASARAPSVVSFQATSPYNSRFQNGATLFPRLFCYVERAPIGRLGLNRAAPVVRGIRSMHAPWKELIRTPADQFGAMRAGHQRKPAWPLTRSRSALRATH